MSLNIPSLRRDQAPPPSRMTRCLRSIVLASSIATGGTIAASLPDEISMIQQLKSNSGLVITDRHASLITGKLIASIILAGSFACWRQSLNDDENQWMKKFHEGVDNI